MQAAQLPGVWESDNSFASDNNWDSSKTGVPAPCVCDWRSNPYHLRRCNWWHCGPPRKSVSADGIIQFYRNRHNNEHVSDFNAMVKVGGSEMWMILDTTTSTTWVMSVACFTVGCQKVKTYSGAFIPAMPPLPAPIDLLEGGLFQILSMVGINGHTSVNLGGVSVSGTPFHFGILDLGTLNPMAFNHTGAVGLAYWEENWPWQLIIIDPMLSILDFMRCGSIFYPIPMAPIPVPKDFPLWAMPPFFPSGYMLKFSFFFGDTGGCFFMNKAPSPFQRSGMSRVMLMPMPAIKLLNPSWMFMIQDVKVGAHSLRPCLIPALCRGHFATGQFAVTGPLFPMLAMLEAVAAPLTCEHLELLPQVSFVIMGKRFVMDRQDYTILGWSFDTVQCMTAFTPEFQLIPGMDLWGLGDTFIRAYYLQLDVQPLRSAKLGLADQPYYEKNGCTGNGIGPVAKIKKPKVESSNRRGADASNAGKKERGSTAASMFWKRRQNWEDDIRGMAANKQQAASDAGSPKCEPVRGDDGQVRFQTVGGRCLEPWQGEELIERSLAAPKDSPEGLASASEAAFGSILVQTAAMHKQSIVPQTADRAMDVDADYDVNGALASLTTESANPASGPVSWDNVRTLQDLPSELQAGLARVTGGLSRLSAEHATDASTTADVTDPTLHSDKDRLASLDPEERRRVVLAIRNHTAEQLRRQATLLELRRLDRVKRGVEPPQVRASNLPANAHREQVRELRDRRAARAARAMHLAHAMEASRFGASRRPAPEASTSQHEAHDAMLLQAFGLGHNGCAHRHPSVDLESLPSGSRGHTGPQTTTGEPIGCNSFGEAVVLPRLATEIASPEEELVLIRNMSAIMRHIEATMNVSSASTVQYWRGESEPLVHAMAADTLAEYRNLVERAQREAANHGLASNDMLERIRAFVMRQDADPKDAEEAGRPATLTHTGGGSVLLQTTASGDDAFSPHSGDSGALERLAILTALEVVSTAHRQSMDSAVTAMVTALESAELDHADNSEGPAHPWTAVYEQPHESD